MSVLKINIVRPLAVRGEIEAGRRGTTSGVLAGQSHLRNQRLGPDRTGRYDRDVNMCVADGGSTRAYGRDGGRSDERYCNRPGYHAHGALPSTSFSCNPEGPPLWDALIV